MRASQVSGNVREGGPGRGDKQCKGLRQEGPWCILGTVGSCVCVWSRESKGENDRDEIRGGRGWMT